MSALERFSRPTRQWFSEHFSAPTPVQEQGWQTIVDGRHALLAAPTGSGKTLAAFLAAIDACANLSPDAPPGVRVIYVSPLKALVYDVERNLRSPLVGIRQAAAMQDIALRDIDIAIRTGDTPQKVRQQQARTPADILVTTPESLYLMLGAQARETLRMVQTVIIDEIHALAPTKRGVHLSLSLERLADLCAADPQRIGLSATVQPIDEAARFLGGTRAVEIIDASARPNLDLQVKVPVPDMEKPQPAAPPPGGSILGQLARREDSQATSERGIWPAIYPELLSLIEANRSTIIFVNSRGLCERLTQRLNELAGSEVVQSHHGSVSHEQRARIEEGLKQGAIRGIVATSSLELGIDMGAIDCVVMVESPGSVARGLQRVGRAGHQVGETSVGRVFPKFRGDLLECAVIARRMRAGEIEPLHVPQNVLDVLAQQIVAMCCDRERRVADIEQLIARAYPYRNLSSDAFSGVLDMLSGHYPSNDFADLKPMLSWDRADDLLRPRRGAAMTARMNAGTIPDRGNYTVTLGAEGGRLGELDEEMVFESRAGENILLGATTWRIEEITRDRVIVSPAPGEPGKLPFWRGDGPGRPIELGRALGAFVAEVGGMSRTRAVRWLSEEIGLDGHAASNLVDYLEEQREQTGSLPTDRGITVERFRDELGDWRLCILSPFGARVHAPWSMALQQLLANRHGFDVQVMYTDDGIVLRFADVDELPDLDALLPDPDELEELVTAQLGHTAMFAGLFRENAARALLLPRRRPDQRTPLWAQRLKAQNLLAAVRQYPSFPIVLETYRQALSDVFDIAALRDLLQAIQSRRVRVHEVETRSASPFARSLVFAYVAAYIYEQDSPLAERKAQALTLDRNLLAELLGQDELRELIDADVLSELEAELQHRIEGRKARDADELHDLLRRLGDLSEAEIIDRAACDVTAALERLQRERRAVPVKVAAERRWIAAEQAAQYRDALGTPAPAGLPEAFLAAVDNPLAWLCRRYAQSHGPFLTADVAGRLGLRDALVEPVLRSLQVEGSLVLGEIRPDGVAMEWCDAEVLRKLKRRTLARLRNAVAPVDDGTLGLFLPQWHDLGSAREGMQRLLEIVQQLQGLPIAWSVLHGSVLPARMAGFQLDMLDMLAATGQVVWVGCGPLGARDGRVALYLREHVRELLLPRDEPPADDPLQTAILDALDTHGALFLFEIEDKVRATFGEVGSQAFKDALWDLVWSGHVTNDTFAPLRALKQRAPRKAGRRWQGGSTLAGGRWSRVEALVDSSVDDTRRAIAFANMLLDRYGVVSREMAAAEELPGGFNAIYKVLASLEDSGRVRRGYFVEGLSGAQFARPGCVDRLRNARSEWNETGDPDEIAYLQVNDPANPWGSLLTWPDSGGAAGSRPRRVAGAWLLLHQGRPVLYLGANGRQVMTFPSNLHDPEVRAAAFLALAETPRLTRRRSLIIEKVDGVAVNESPLREELIAAGFRNDYRGLAAEAFA